jgi:plastocyanin
MNVDFKDETYRKGYGVRRLVTTMLAICMPVVLGALFGGGLFKVGTLEASHAHAAGHAPTADVSVSISDSSFNPATITIDPGTRVTWTNNGSNRHRVRDAGHNLFDSDDLNPGQSFSYIFNTPGTIQYLDERDGFTGTVIVSGTPPSTTPGTTGTAQTTGTPGATNTPVSGNVVQVNIFDDDGFSPANITVQSGTTVRWTNYHHDEHTVTSPGNFNSGDINTGQSWQYNFVVNGTYSYFCAYHSEMQGTITVVGGPTATPQSTSTPAQGTVNVSIQNFSFTPQNITIQAGSTVRWTNNDSTAHTATSPGNFDSGNLNSGGSYQFTFNTPGTYTYFCAYHAGMTGTITVTSAGGGSSPTATPQITNTPQATNTPVGGGTVEVAIQNFAFTPQNINAGTTVRWTNNDTYQHSATSPGNFDSGPLNQGQSWQFTFNTPGTYNYLCAYHAGMTGTITVVGGSTATPQATATPTAPQPTSTPGGGTTVNVSIQNFAFAPQNITISAGTTVRWTNNDAYPHTATANGGAFNSGTLNQNDTYHFTFTTPGTYTYYCGIHTAMTGTITVTGSGGGNPTNTPAASGTGTVQPTMTATRTRTAQPTGTVAPQVVTVDIRNYAYSPATITIQAGTRVRWTNLDNDRHSITDTASPARFDSGLFAPNGTWSYVFNTPGTYTYYCSLHGTFMSGTVIVQAAATATPTRAPGQQFNDVLPADYFFAPVNWLVSRGIVSGYSDGTFRPYNNTTRGQVTKMIVLGEGWAIAATHPTFSDVPATDPFFSYIETAASHGVISGYSDGTFRPGNNVTRGQLAKIIVGARGWTLANPTTNSFNDVPFSNTFFRYIETAVQRQIISGYADGSFRPGNNATRGQISKILYNALNGAQ